MSHSIRVLLVGASSLVVGIAVAFVVSLVERSTGLALFGFSAAVVIPVGAIGCGLVAAVGFYAAARALHVRSVGSGLVIPSLAALVSFVSAHWFSFTRSLSSTNDTLAGVPASDGLGFIDYLRMMATESSVMGVWGYGVVALQVIGFALGGWCVSTVLRQQPWCEVSHRFLDQRGAFVSYFEDPSRFEVIGVPVIKVEVERSHTSVWSRCPADPPQPWIATTKKQTVLIVHRLTQQRDAEASG